MSAQPAPRRFGGASEKCDICTKTVYEMEKLSADSKVFHKNCFKCEQCKKILSLGNYAGAHGKYYCKPHFKQLFALNGNYDSGFGEEQHKTKWPTGAKADTAAVNSE